MNKYKVKFYQPNVDTSQKKAKFTKSTLYMAIESSETALIKISHQFYIEYKDDYKSLKNMDAKQVQEKLILLKGGNNNQVREAGLRED